MVREGLKDVKSRRICKIWRRILQEISMTTIDIVALSDVVVHVQLDI